MKTKQKQWFTTAAMALALAASGCAEDKKAEQPAKGPDKGAKPADKGDQAEVKAPPKVEVPPAPAIPAVPPGLAALGAPPESDDNPTTPDKVALGELLFFDTRLSDGGKFSCESCHYPEKGWTDNEKLSTKHDAKVNTRHSPTMFNVAYAQEFYWDGRMPTLEAQIAAAWKGQVGGTPEKVAEKLAAVPEYAERFKRAFNAPPSADNIPQALAAFLRGKVRLGDSPWDRHKAGEEGAVSEDAIKGHEVFNKAGCVSCHAEPLFTDLGFHNVGVGYEGVKEPDLGRGAHTKAEIDNGKFKTPGLRGLVWTAPYFHDGSAATLEEAVDFMLAGGYRKGNKNIDKQLKKAKLKKGEREQLIAFLKALTPETYDYVKPTVPK